MRKLLAALENGELAFKRIADYEKFVEISRQAVVNYFKKNAASGLSAFPRPT